MSRRLQTCLTLLAFTGTISGTATAVRATTAPDPSLCVVVDEGCYVPGSVVRLTLELGQSEHLIAGGQFLIRYDPASMEFVKVSPGTSCSLTSPFVLELYEEVDTVNGEITYAVGVDPEGDPPTSGPATMACLSFVLLGDSAANVCLSEDWMSNFLVDDGGESVTIDNTEDCPVESMPPTVSCGEIEVADTCFCDTGTPDCSAFDDDCNVGVCNEGTARCEPVPTNEGGACDDGNSCTTTDVCIEGVCVGTGCTNQSVCIVADEGCLAVEGARFRIELGGGDPYIIGGQFSIQYDPDALEFLDAIPGVMCDPQSPFVMEVSEQVDEAGGDIFYAVGIDFLSGGEGTQGNTTLACLDFAFTGDSPTEVCLLSGVNPLHTELVDSLGQAVSIYNADDCPPDAPPPVLSCDEAFVDEDCECVPGTEDCSALDTQCRLGVCNEQTGRCEVERLNDEPCDDQNSCTKNDRCVQGKCLGFACRSPSLCIVEDDCVGPGLLNQLEIHLGEGDAAIVGGQFSISYDPTALAIVDISPGAACDNGSPFVMQVYEHVDAVNGHIFYAVGVDFMGGSGTTGPATMACLTVIALRPDPGEICIFDGFNPYLTILVDEVGNPLRDFNPYDCPTDHPPPIISCDEVCTIPTLGTWGLVVLTLLLLVTAKIRFGLR